MAGHVRRGWISTVVCRVDEWDEEGARQGFGRNGRVEALVPLIGRRLPRQPRVYSRPRAEDGTIVDAVRARVVLEPSVERDGIRQVEAATEVDDNKKTKWFGTSR